MGDWKGGRLEGWRDGKMSKTIMAAQQHRAQHSLKRISPQNPTLPTCHPSILPSFHSSILPPFHSSHPPFPIACNISGISLGVTTTTPVLVRR
jgi:hypothetical protein